MDWCVGFNSLLHFDAKHIFPNQLVCCHVFVWHEFQIVVSTVVSFLHSYLAHCLQYYLPGVRVYVVPPKVVLDCFDEVQSVLSQPFQSFHEAF